jgi:hypothetical protein
MQFCSGWISIAADCRAPLCTILRTTVLRIFEKYDRRADNLPVPCTHLFYMATKVKDKAQAVANVEGRASKCAKGTPRSLIGSATPHRATQRDAGRISQPCRAVSGRAPDLEAPASKSAGWQTGSGHGCSMTCM